MNKKTTTKNKNVRKKSSGKKVASNTRKSTTRNSKSKSTNRKSSKKDTPAKSKVNATKSVASKRRPRKSTAKKTTKAVEKRTKVSEENDDRTTIKLVVKKPVKRKRGITKIAEVTAAAQKAKESNNGSTTAPQKPIVTETQQVTINQNVAILIDGNNIEKSIHSLVKRTSAMLDFDNMIPKLLRKRGLNRLIYFREGLHISSKLADRLHKKYFGTVVPCHKSADIPLSITATQLADKVDTIIILSGDSDYVDLVRHLRSRGVRVEIAAIKQTTAKILIDEADFFTEITKEDCYIL